MWFLAKSGAPSPTSFLLLGGWGVQFTALLNSIYSPWMGIQPFTGFINYSALLPLSSRWSLPFSCIRHTDSQRGLLLQILKNTYAKKYKALPPIPLTTYVSCWDFFTSSTWMQIAKEALKNKNSRVTVLLKGLVF